MASTNGTAAPTDIFVPDQLFHTLLTVVDFSHDSSGATRTPFVLKSHGTLDAAKAFARQSLETLGFAPEDFELYRVREPQDSSSSSSSTSSSRPWTHGDGVLVFARAFDGKEFIVGIDTAPNNESLAASSSDGELRLPEGARFLHYVLQITIDYNADRSGAAQTTEIQGAYIHRADAWKAAHLCLDPAQYAEFDRRGDAQFIEEWPYGEDVAVHAVSETGQNSFVAVKRPPEQRHELKPHNLKKK
ncbi:uncharacterized protein TRIREDRAFT_44967 [Trichoderma reesei QM6a]|jgi:hypothetical protein|uniref:Predicted protein n=2 Tax=Hypocrea jecorina TaxID=51453 RepID=G0R9T4_HYPJQ|nr:uncharacterized protein TRIREDRAFT_44967 [Trichoderma reesei QM6a]EGR52013.1 predicted protein [Trichoderma reesei QM6a]ETS05344.1 hypothetical protein M419DRAFT_121966 [Trichoderma reesei RUT C-30]